MLSKQAEKLLLHPRADPNRHQKVITSRGSPLAHVYHVWSTSITAFVSYLAQRQNDRTNDNITPPALAEL